MSTKKSQNAESEAQNPRGTTRLTSAGVRAIKAAILAELDGYDLIADKMDAMNVDAISMTGLDSLEQAVIRRIQGNIEGARRALNKETSGSLKETASKLIANRKTPSEKAAANESAPTTAKTKRRS